MRFIVCTVLGLLVPALAGPAIASTTTEIFVNLDHAKISTGILYDRVLPMSGIDNYDGSPHAKAVSLTKWKQIYHEISRAALSEDLLPACEVVSERAEVWLARGMIPLAWLNMRYNRIRPDALCEGSLVLRRGRLFDGEGMPYLEATVLAASAVVPYTYRGNRVTFVLDSDLYFSNYRSMPTSIDVDFDDGLGYRAASLGDEITVQYAAAGSKTVRATIGLEDGTLLYGSFAFEVRSLQTPDPHDTLAITATIPYGGEFASGEAYVYLSDLHTSITNPVIVIEGFDIDNAMGWDELYNLLNQEGLIETLRTDGYDAVVLNFTNATDYIQRNSFVITELIEAVQAAIGPDRTIALIGASMGGLAGRYALAYMETEGYDHRVRTFISFDSPQTGADIPLGIQYWVKFFSEDSEAAAEMLAGLDTPAARQMLVYHYTDPPGATGQSDPLRADLLGELALVGDWPAGLRKVAVANGSGTGADQGFAPGEQIIMYEYNSLLVDIVGNVWAVPDSANHTIFDGLMDLIWPLPDRDMVVYVEGTRPFDSAPGGWRPSMAQMDSTEAPYGDIVALHEHHCFIPTVSALAVDTEDLFYDIAGDADLLSHTPFDTLYYPVENEEHVLITPENAIWFRDEIKRGDQAGIAAGDRLQDPSSVSLETMPNPFTASTTLRYRAPVGEIVSIDIYTVTGRHIAVLVDGVVTSETGLVTWQGCDSRGRPVAPGTYFCRVKARDADCVRRIVIMR